MVERLLSFDLKGKLDELGLELSQWVLKLVASGSNRCGYINA